LDEFFPEFGPLRRFGTYRFLHCVVLVGGLAAAAAMTVSAIRDTDGIWLGFVLWACFAFFLFEWGTRGWVAAHEERLAAYLFSAEGLIDALAVLPIPLALLAGVPAQSAWLLSALWLLKLAPLVPGLALLGRVVAQEARPLTSVLVLFLIILFLAAVALHVLERDSQPDKFGSLPGALWWAVTTMTTTGYGDSVPDSSLGRVIGGLVMLSGLGLAGLWTGIMATGFAAEHRRRDFITNWELVSKVPFLRSLDPAGIIEITRMLRRLDVPERTVVVRRGRTGDCMYFIASGEVEVKVEPHPVRLGPGAFFGELALLGGGIRNATVATVSPTTLLVLDLTDFRAFAASHPDLARAVEAEAERRLGHESDRASPPPLVAESLNEELTDSK
jgi:voltage-gated potassium channel